MEELPTIEPLTESPKSPDLMNVFSDTVVTIHGLTGKIGDLAQICPLDLNDPRISIETKNDFVAKVINEAAIEVPNEHASYISKVLEKQGIESKFTVTPDDKNAPAEASNLSLPTKSDKNTSLDNQQLVASRTTNQASNLATDQPISIRQVTAERQQNLEAVDLANMTQAFQLQQEIQMVTDNLTDRLKPKTKKPWQPNQLKDFQVFREPLITFDVLNQIPSTSIQPQELDQSLIAAENGGSTLTSQNEVNPTPKLDQTTSADVLYSELEQTNLSIETELIVSNEDNNETVDVIDWQEILDQEPVEIYEVFRQSLLDFIATNETNYLVSLFDQELTYDPKDELDAADQLTELHPVPSIAVELTEKLVTLETSQKEFVGLQLKGIIEALSTISQLEADTSETANVDLEKQKLSEMVKDLFEYLDLDYQAEDIEQFINFLIESKIQPKIALNQDEVIIDLEHNGTREVKQQRLRPFLNNRDSLLLANFQIIIGQLAIFYSYPNNNLSLIKTLI